jgi:hypothetical protein
MFVYYKSTTIMLHEDLIKSMFTILYDVFSIQYNFAFSLNFRCEYSTRRAAHLKNEPIVGYNLDFARSNLNFEHGFLPDSIFEFCSSFKKHFCGES